MLKRTLTMGMLMFLFAGCATVDLNSRRKDSSMGDCYGIYRIDRYQDTFLGKPVGEQRINVILKNGVKYLNANPRYIIGYDSFSPAPLYCPAGIPLR